MNEWGRSCALGMCALSALFAWSAQARTLRVDSAASDAAAQLVYADIHSAVEALEEGDELLIAAGVYREPIDLRDKRWKGLERTVVAGDPAGGTLIVGSRVVEGWRRLAPDRYELRNWSISSQQVFIGGRQLSQVGGDVFEGYPSDADHRLHAVGGKEGIWPGRRSGNASRLPAESFYYDAERRVLTVRTQANLAQERVEVSVDTFLFYSDIDRLTLRDITFEHSNTTATSRQGAVVLKGSDLDISRVHVRYADGIGIQLGGDRIRLADSTSCFCGELGLAARGNELELLGNETSYNNTRGFSMRWEAGGAKFIGEGGLHNSIVARHRSLHNAGPGLWFDNGNPNNTLCGSVLAFNESHGVHFEASGGGTVATNGFVGNGGRGIYLSGAHDLLVAANLVMGAGLEGIAAVDQGKGDGKDRILYPASGNHFLGNLVAWSDLSRPGFIAVMPVADAANSADYNLYVSDGRPPGFASEWGALRVTAHGLEDWVRISGNDAHARTLSAPTPTALAQARTSRGPPPETGQWLRGVLQPWAEATHDMPGAVLASLPAACPRDVASWLAAALAEGSKCQARSTSSEQPTQHDMRGSNDD